MPDPVMLFAEDDFGKKKKRTQVANRRVTPAVTVADSDVLTLTLEKRLGNGDLYIGRFSGDVPHGLGKYLWTDGCMYEGDWKRGKASGKGKFSWPSGATYEGEFKSGRMEGFGIFVGSEGDTYRGSWTRDRKQGYGVKYYANGDCYDGSWRRNLQDGHGRYVWSNGNEYVGEWRGGVINGRGILIWGNCNRYDGNWENGVPKGQGIFTWPDGSWNKKNGINFGHKFAAPWLAEEKSSSVDRNLPRICVWESDGEAGDITCDIIDNLEISMCYRDGFRQFRNREVKKPGQTIFKEHKNYELMLNLQLGIRHSVGKHASILRDLKDSDFDPSKKFWTKFPAEGSRLTPPHQSTEFRWKDYCPMVFRHLRELFQVDPADYMLAICGNHALRELSSPGKSGSLFYLTQDDRFIIKTVKKSEVKVLIKMLSSYYNHVTLHENSLLTKFFGVHCVKPVGGIKTRFIVMGNLFHSEYQIHRRFDLKGSSHGRTTHKQEEEIDETTTLKDLDLNFTFRLQQNCFQNLINQVQKDCEFLESQKIMDYSLLVGLHFRDHNNNRMDLSPFFPKPNKTHSFQSEKLMRGCRILQAELQDMDRVLSGRKPLIRLGANMPARAEWVGRRRRRSDYGLRNGGEIHDVVIYFGIIDILQDYDIGKKIEHVYKSLHVDSNSISAVDPKMYSKRFRDFIGRTFVEDG